MHAYLRRTRPLVRVLLFVLLAALTLPFAAQSLKAYQQLFTLAPGDRLSVSCETSLSGTVEGKQAALECAAPTAAVTPTATTATPGGPQITALTNLQDGQAVRGTANIEALVSGTNITQVVFRLDGPKPAVHTEKYKPYFFMGDTSGKPNGWNTTSYPDGAYTLSATVTDSAGRSSTRQTRFSVANGIVAPSSQPATSQPATSQPATPTRTPTAAPSPTTAAGPSPTQQAGTGVQLTVNYNSVISTIEHPFWGVNYVGFWDPIQGSAASRQALKNAGIQVLRFPGGEPANWLDWSKPAAAPYWTSTSTDELWQYAQAIGAQLLLQTNPTANNISDTKETNDPTGAHAAGWVTYTKDKGIAAPYWEIGNEPDLKLQNDWDRAALKWYFDAFEDQARAMRQANPAIKIFGPVGTNAWQWWGRHSLDMFLERFGNRQGNGLADGVSLHYYPTSGCQNWDSVSAEAQKWPNTMSHIKQVIAQYDTRQLPVFISETNAAVGGQKCEINRTMAAALANADLFGAYRATGVQAIQFFGAIHGSDSWGFLYGSGDVRAADTPTPSYFIFPIWTKAGNQVVQVTGLTDPSKLVSAYAARKADGTVQIIIINKTQSTQPVTVRFDGFDPTGRQARIYELKPASGGVGDQDVIYNGVRMPNVSAANLPAPAAETIGGASYTRSVPGYSLTLIDVGGR